VHYHVSVLVPGIKSRALCTTIKYSTIELHTQHWKILLKIKILIFMFNSVSVEQCRYVHMSVAALRGQKNVRSLTAGLTDSCELPSMGAQTPTQVLSKSNAFS